MDWDLGRVGYLQPKLCSPVQLCPSPGKGRSFAAPLPALPDAPWVLESSAWYSSDDEDNDNDIIIIATLYWSLDTCQALF